ncbi:MAG TPA: DEAD/DEAH box helicase family protein [Thermodesulfobacteriota bacterium]|nr:DEAD/DEAH box helicase family protein [Deltaproteobacteria bacterium]HNR11851.1 DEAD/DEAH box helicase family protein [Thermodesulfobacteriota bacterium]HNU70094.1 DEAD/DEAH box helicase family protein [Thermodesulfobacteriota bacterium]HQO78225.1 DEAD/DEAH box helicase family protein [Thermodesulfobacteriota bacterium]
MLQLKTYQEKALESLQRYLSACDELKDASLAFYKVSEELGGQGLSYRPIKEPSALADIPYVCLRLPTGGGKTLLACHAVAVANKEYLKQDQSLVLWLVPSNAIREQTLKALRDRDHFYRQALESTVGTVEVMDITEALSLHHGTMLGATVIIVATLQAFRVEDKEGRKVYDTAGALQHHFTNIPQEIREILYRDENGVVPCSLENVMRIHRPLVIVDEAHNARTELSFDTLARFRPSAIIEFTATPDSSRNPSNVLHSTSAAELKAEDMIKLPILLETRTDWQALLGDAIARRNDLESKALLAHRRGGDYIRPIMLLQAQPRRKDRETLTVEVIEKSLLEDHHIPENQIARATGEDRGLEGIDLAFKTCEIRYIITVQALREGWDCPFAYVLCSLAEQRSSGAVEQILGRVLRLPYCRKYAVEDLGRAYAFVASPNFVLAAQSLEDALVENGFNKQEARDFITPVAPSQLLLHFTREQTLHTTIPLQEVPDPYRLSPGIKEKIIIDEANKTVTVKAYLQPEEQEEISRCFISDSARSTWITAIRQYRDDLTELYKSPAERGKMFYIPLLCIKRGNQLELFEEDHLLGEGWDLTAFDPRLTPEEFALLSREEGEFGEIDIAADGKIRSRFIHDLNRQLQLIEEIGNWTEAALISWLDTNLRFIEIASEQKEIFLTAMVGDLLDNRGMTLGQLLRRKFDLRKIAEQKIKNYRQQARQQIHQKLLFEDDGSKIIVSPERCFSFARDQYPMRFPCAASESFRRHYYSKVGDFADKGEEFLCARFIDHMEETEYWVRNLDRQPNFSFWLQTSTDKFYPDFVCKLKDGRYLVVEYKGADRWSNDDSKEKRRLGELWALKSGGACLFVMPRGMDWGAIRAVVARDNNVN